MYMLVVPIFTHVLVFVCVRLTYKAVHIEMMLALSFHVKTVDCFLGCFL